MPRVQLADIRVRPKLIALLMILGILPMAIVSWSGRRCAHSTMENERSIAAAALEAEALRSLETQRDLQKGAIEDYFASLRSEAVAFATHPATVGAMKRLTKAFHGYHEPAVPDAEAEARKRKALSALYESGFTAEYRRRHEGREPGATAWLAQLDGDAAALQYRWLAEGRLTPGEGAARDAIGDGSAYDAAHRAFHPLARARCERSGFEDVLLVDGATGDVVYSLAKNLDFGTSLLDGPHAMSNCGNAFRKANEARRADEAFLVDFESYAPRYEQPVGFIASPVFDGDAKLGVILLPLPRAGITALMRRGQDPETRAETYLVGADRLPRSDPAFGTEAHHVNRAFQSPDSGRIGSPIVASALEGKADSRRGENYAGTAVLGSAAPLDLPGLYWAIVAEKEEAKALAPLAAMSAAVEATESRTLWSSLGIALVAAAFLLVAALGVARMIAAPLDQVSEGLGRLARGELGHDADTERGDEFGDLARAMDDAVQGLRAGLGRDRVRWSEFAANREEALRLRSAVEGLASSLMMTDETGRIVQANPACQRLLREREADLRRACPAFSMNQLIGFSLAELLPRGGEGARLLDATREPVLCDVGFGQAEFSISAVALVDEAGRPRGLVLEWRDITSRRHAEERLAALIGDSIEGRLDARLDLSGFEGFLRGIAEGINRLLESVVGPIREANRTLEALATGDLTTRMSGDYAGEFASLKDSINRSVESMAGMVDELRESASSIAASSAEIASGNGILSKRTEDQAASLQQTAASMEELTGTVQQNAANARQANQLAASARELAERGGQVVGDAVVSMSAISESSKRIANIIGVIDEIAFQTNLLALNAAVEAARAGEQGRGFAVVAGEVRNLAQRSASAAKEIKDLIEDSLHKVEQGGTLVDDSGKTLEEIVVSVKKVSDIVAEIAAASREQATGIDQVNQAVTQMDQVTQGNQAMVEEAAATSETLDELARDLDQQMARFTVASREATPKVRPSVRATRPVETPAPAPTMPRPEPRAPAPPVPAASAAPKLPPAEPAPDLSSSGLDVDPDDPEWQEF